MSCTPSPKPVKPVWANQLTRLPCVVVYDKLLLVYIGNANVSYKEVYCRLKGKCGNSEFKHNTSPKPPNIGRHNQLRGR